MMPMDGLETKNCMRQQLHCFPHSVEEDFKRMRCERITAEQKRTLYRRGSKLFDTAFRTLIRRGVGTQPMAGK